MRITDSGWILLECSVFGCFDCSDADDDDVDKTLLKPIKNR
jgi:hypothetical protein